MEPKGLKNYLRAHRKRSGLTTEDVALLLGFESATTISRVEGNSRKPSARVLLGAEILFGEPIGELFPHLYADVEEAILRQASRLHERLQGDPSAGTKAKLNFLEQVLARAVARNAQQ